MADNDMSQSVEGSMELTSGEQVVAKDEFIYSLVHFFLKTKASLTERRLVYQRVNTVLGVIPVGSQTDTLPPSNIAAVGTSTRLGILRMLLGLLLVLIGLSDVSRAWLALIVGLLLILSAFQAIFYVSTNGGQRYQVRIAVTDKGKAQAFAERVNEAIVKLHSPSPAAMN